MILVLLWLIWAIWIRWYRHRPPPPRRIPFLLLELWQIRISLRSGQLPEALGHRISPQNVWRVGSYVVKTGHRVMAKDKARTLAGIYSIRLAPSVREGKWLIQLYYRPGKPGTYQRYLKRHGLTGDRIGADMHENNVGIDKRGRWVAFDW